MYEDVTRKILLMLQFVIRNLGVVSSVEQSAVVFEILTMNGNGLSNLRPSLSVAVWRNYILILTHDETCHPHLSPLPLDCQATTKMCKGVSGCSQR